MGIEGILGNCLVVWLIVTVAYVGAMILIKSGQNRYNSISYDHPTLHNDENNENVENFNKLQ